MTHICAGNLTIIGSDNGLSCGRRHANIRTSGVVSSIGHVGTTFSQIVFEIRTFSFNKIDFKPSSTKWQPFYSGLNVCRLDTNISWLYAHFHCQKQKETKKIKPFQWEHTVLHGYECLMHHCIAIWLGVNASYVKQSWCNESRWIRMSRDYVYRIW